MKVGDCTRQALALELERVLYVVGRPNLDNPAHCASKGARERWKEGRRE